MRKNGSSQELERVRHVAVRMHTQRAAHQKKSRRLNATLVFWDESGFLMLPIVRRTWVPRGQTPVLYHNAKRMRIISAIGMRTLSPGRPRLTHRWETNLTTNTDWPATYANPASRYA